MKTVNDAFELFKPVLDKIYSSEETEAITLLVLNDITGYNKAKIKAFPETTLKENEIEKLQVVLERLATGEPVQYILGHTNFYGLDFKVNASVLIPRPETEELVQWIIETTGDKRANIIDIGTGSGCIPVTLKHNLPQSKLCAIDISEAALATARDNALLNDTEVEFLLADILKHNELHFAEKFDVVVSNPPYVTETDKLQMHNNVTGFEPHTALFVPEQDPLIFYNVIADFALQHIKPNGQLFFEINESYGKEMIDLLTNKGFTDIELRKDMSGRDRMIRGTR
ncbi:peptide chain release factor N(5)-glutamine methyltransferase [Mucilaginibacter sp. KACC 22063]|uniref:peptide chain release factor N(5)-glutamine methyltransferase n=1 Tax=Mucilaginibacter sp. KACC 22063 TaxID=3025666 RepID=UPI002365E7F1|nr:peptide chain release factor N(5)-glutamine methyltransferase [Mucilaginibacter sp. KACC 22063]WDF53502.1 peptide chain release factor N(5)-glutamine methyltransferase [Mucilaginibacter sp. KACC 22063]